MPLKTNNMETGHSYFFTINKKVGGNSFTNFRVAELVKGC
jgi:hypothetical protein